MEGYLTIDGDTFTATCPHATVITSRTHDPHAPEPEEIMIRMALQRHSSYCEHPCMMPHWKEWFRKLRERCEREQREKQAIAKIKGKSL